MGFFKTTRDQLKGNALKSHLEFANQFFKPTSKPTDMIRCEHHIRGAQKALIAFRAAQAEYIFSDEGWLYLSALTEPLQVALRMGGFTQLAGDLAHIVNYVNRVLGQRGIAVEPLFSRDREDPISDSELAIFGPVDENGFLIEPLAASRVMRDPFPFPSSNIESRPPLTTSGETLNVIPAWQTAARELGIRITTNKAVTHHDKVALVVPIHLPDFGGPSGILLWTGSIQDSETIDRLEHTASACGYRYAVINPEFYSVYDRELFTSFLCRLRFSGQPDLRPGWYTLRDE